jgi:hypothetical protein
VIAMPIKVKIDHDKRWVEALAEGDVSLGDIEEFLDAVILGDALSYRKLFDGRAAYGKYTDEEVMRLAARLSAYASLGRRGPVALVPSVEYYELASRVLNLDRREQPARAFLDIDEARRWLDAQPEVD